MPLHALESWHGPSVSAVRSLSGRSMRSPLLACRPTSLSAPVPRRFPAGPRSTLLHLATSRGYKDLAQRILAAAPEAATWACELNMLPLHLAVRGGHAAVVELLLAAAPQTAMGLDVAGRAPLHSAAAAGDAAMVRLLLGAAPEAAMVADTKDGLLPLHLAVGQGNVEAAQLLV